MKKESLITGTIFAMLIISFTFIVLAQTEPFAFITIKVDATDTGAIISWETTIPAKSYLQYGTSTRYDNRLTVDDVFLNNARVIVNGLKPDTKYHYRVKGLNALGEQISSGDLTFITLSAEEKYRMGK